MVLVVGFWVAAAAAQPPPSTSLKSSFAAIIVRDLDRSVKWYERVLGFEMAHTIELPQRGVFITNLSREGADLELLMLADALDAQSLSEDVSEGTRFYGLFKVGFEVADFSEWLAWFDAQEVEFHGRAVTDPHSGKEMVILKDPDGNYIQIFEE